MKLNVLKRNQPIQEIDLGKSVLSQDYSETVFLVGRSKNCHIVLDDKKVSREHLRIIHKNGKWIVEKTAPENSCQINGENFNRHELESGDVITVENFSIAVLDDGKSEKDASSSIEVAVAIKPTALEIKKTETTNVTLVDKSTISATKKTEVAAQSDSSGEESIDQDSTGEINTSAFGNDLANEEFEIESLENQPVNELDQSESSEDSEFLNEDRQETEAAIALSQELNENTEEENTTYSLENIDTPDQDENTRVIQSFASIYLELFGDTAPYDKFIVENEKTFIGRDPKKCQIVLNDTEVSTVHAVLTKNNIMVTLEDLNSSNGTIFKGDRVNKVILGHNDEFVIGGVTFTLKIKSEFLKEESSTLMAVDENQTVEVEEVVEIEAEEGEELDALGEMVEKAPAEKSIIKRVWKDEQMRKKAIYGIVVLVAAWLFLGEDDKPVVNTPNKQSKAKIEKKPIVNTSMKKLSEEQRRSLSALYEIGKDHYQNGRYREALVELQKVAAVDTNFNSSLQSLIALSKEGLSKIEEEEKKRQAEIIAAEKKAKVKALLEKAREYTKDRRVDLATTAFNDITQLEPENLEVTRMKMELDDWQKEKAKKELEELQKKKDREEKVEQLKPGRTLYLQKEWFKAIGKLEDFLRIKNMDDDLTTEATNMLKVSRDELNSAVSPLVGKAKSLLEGQDLKGAYEVYQQILRIEPSNSEALNQTGDIKEQLTNRARKIYREAIIAESLSLFQDAKEKFQEVQQISPVDSDYYKKASDKLRDYLD